MLRGRCYCQEPLPRLSPAPHPPSGWPQILTKYLELHGGLGGARCPCRHHAHIVPLVAHLGLRQHQAPLAFQLVWGAAVPRVVHLGLDLRALHLDLCQEVPGPRTFCLWEGRASARGCPATLLSIRLFPCPCLSAALWLCLFLFSLPLAPLVLSPHSPAPVP